MDETLKHILTAIENAFHPVSVFLYGSRARTDFLDRSDYEVGVLYKKDTKVSRTELKEINPSENIHLYPFEYEDFLNYKLDTPFPEAIYLRELIVGGLTIAGEKVVEKLSPPPIKVLDLLERVRFDMGFTLAALLSYRQGDMVTAKMEFAKSCLFGIRSLVVLRLSEFPLTYDGISEASTRLNLEKEYADVVQHAIDVRKGTELQEASLYKNISLLNKIVKDEIVKVFKQSGNVVVLE